MPSTSLPIFPLNTVLFPGGLLPLRVFEARYMDMVRAAMRDGSDFGVCLIRKGNEVGERSHEIEDVGCRARIDHWNMEQLGVLEIATTGTERFHVVSKRVQGDGLMVAEIEALEAEPETPLPTDAADCQLLLRRIVERLDSERAAATGDEPMPPAIAEPYRFDDATWVGNRLCELLPIAHGAKQKLMALTDAPTRLEIVQRYLKQHGIV